MAKVPYTLQQNEGVVLQNTSVMHGGVMASYTDELILTNLNVIYVKKGVFGNPKGVEIYPLSRLKIVNGSAQAMMGKNSHSGALELQLYFNNGQESFMFQSSGKKEISKWIEAINAQLGTNPIEGNVSSGFVIPGTEQLASTIKGTMDAFKSSLGIKNQAETVVTIKCIGCHVPLTGVRGQQITCKYCDTKQSL